MTSPRQSRLAGGNRAQVLFAGAASKLTDTQSASKLGAIQIAGGGNSAFLDMLELQVDRSDTKGFVPLAFDTTSNYEDTAPQPATPTKWTYRAIYRAGDHQVGQWSAEVSVTVGG